MDIKDRSESSVEKGVLPRKTLPMKEFTSNNKGYTKTNFTSRSPQTKPSSIMKYYGPAPGIYPPSSRYPKPNQFRNGRFMEQSSNDRISTISSIFNSRDKPTKKDDCEALNEVNKTNGYVDSASVVPLSDSGMGDQYNGAGFQTEYEKAKFYVIKSFSEDDVHKCIKYEVWSSTAYGNEKLDAAFHDAQQLKNCPVFLFFSVNGSGQFVGLAEMIGKMDFNKTLDLWQLDKWKGFFPVKWHIMKDIPNHQLRHILLENNENKPVTFTRDAHQVGLKEGLEMLKIFKNYAAKSSILQRAAI